jgi:hypothetical protein
MALARRVPDQAPAPPEHPAPRGFLPVPPGPGLRRSAAGGADELGGSAVPHDVLARLRRTGGTGRGLPAPLAQVMENELGADLSAVRVHTGPDSDAAARSVHAVAFAYGSDLHFRRGTYAPGTEAGNRLLAHEVSHVVQSETHCSTPTIGRADDPAERSADRSADRLVGALRRSPLASRMPMAPGPARPTGVDPVAADPTARGGVNRVALLRSGTETAPTDVARQKEKATGTEVLRRRVGLEFETGIPVRALDPPKVEKLAYQERVFTANSGLWKVVADSSNLEFVTEPFEETMEGRVALEATMKELVAWAGRIQGVVNAANPQGQGRVDQVGPEIGTTGSRGLFGGTPFVIRLATLSDAEFTAAPQATGGVTLDQIPALIEHMAAHTINAAEPRRVGDALKAVSDRPDDELSPEARDIKQRLTDYTNETLVTPRRFASSLMAMNINHATWLVRAKNQASTAVDNHVRAVAARTGAVSSHAKLKGLLTLVVSYLMVGENEAEVMPYSKIIAPLMARTNFYTMFGLLEPHEKEAFTEALVLTAAGMPGTGGTQIFRAGFNHRGAVEHGPTRSAWIQSIREGTPGIFSTGPDLLSQGSGSTAAANSSSLGGQATPDKRSTGQQDLVVLELRRLPKEVQRREWLAMALRIFDIIRSVRGV